MVLKLPINIPLIKLLFNALMEHGIYSDAFIDVLYSDIEDTSNAFSKALQAISYPIPESPQQARDSIIQYHLKRIVEQKEDVHFELQILRGCLYKDDGNYDVYGAAQRLYDEWIRAINEYPFNNDVETDEERAVLDAHLFKVAKDCLKNIVTKKDIKQYGIEFIKHQLQFGPVYTYSDGKLLFVALSEAEYSALVSKKIA